MSKSLTIKDARSCAAARGGECLSETYKNNRTKLRWKCNAGHEWEAPLTSIRFQKSWCPACAGRPHLTIGDARRLGTERGGECLSSEYRTNSSKLRWRCSEGHEWEASYNNVKDRGSWCPHCRGNAKQDIERLRRIASAYDGAVLSTVYINSKAQYLWRCSMGHEWDSTYREAEQFWCPTCTVSSSKAEQDLFAFVESHYPSAVNGIKRLLPNKKFELDIYIPELRKAIEFDGDYWHSSEKQQERDARKTAQCEQVGIALLRVQEGSYRADPEAIQGRVLAFLNNA